MTFAPGTVVSVIHYTLNDQCQEYQFIKIWPESYTQGIAEIAGVDNTGLDIDGRRMKDGI